MRNIYVISMYTTTVFRESVVAMSVFYKNMLVDTIQQRKAVSLNDIIGKS